MNIINHFQWNKPYYLYNREERNLAAIFYHLLLSGNNLQTFLNHLQIDNRVDEYAIYFEYSHLRDIWIKQKDENIKRNYILDTLDYSKDHKLRKCNIFEFNSYFGAVKKPSNKYIQSPGNWAITKYDKNIKDNDEFIEVTRFKWCFNAKPDIVIHLNNDQALCIECKLESGEGEYPSTEKDKRIFDRRKIEYVKQTEIQKLIFKLLGIDANHFLLVQRKTNEDSGVITWKEVFNILDYSDVPPFIKKWVVNFQ